MRTRSTDRFVEINVASMDRSIWSRSGLIYVGLVALIVAVSLTARMAGILPLRETPLPVGETQVETKLPLDHVRGWNPAAAQFPPRQAHDQVNSLPYPWKRS